MRKYPKSNSDIKATMDLVINKFRSKGISDSILILKYIGSIIYLQKVELGIPYLKNDFDFDLTLSDAPQIDKSSAIYTIIESSIKQMVSILGNPTHKDVVGMLSFSFFDVDEYLEWFDYLIDIMPISKDSSLHVTPDWFSVLADAFLCFGEKSVFCPFGGIMKLSTDMNFYQHMYAYEMDTSVWELGMIRLALSNDTRKVIFENKLTETWKNQKYDAIVSFPPFGMRYQQDGQVKMFSSFKVDDSELNAASLFMDFTTDKGVSFSIVTPSLLYNEGENEKFRKWAVEQGIIDTVILLPSKLLSYTGIALAIVILRKQPRNDNAIRMIDASGFYTNYKYQNRLEIGDVMNAYLNDIEHVSRTVSYDEIAENDYSWNIPFYMHIPEETVQEGYKKERIEDLILAFYDSHLNNPQKGKVIKVSDLSDDWTQCTLDMSKLSEEVSNRNMTLLNKKAVVVSTVRSLKPTIVNATEETPVLLSPNVFALILKETIDPEYFCMALAQSGISAMTSNMAIPYISRTSILRWKISYPDLSHQKEICKEARKTLLLAKAKEAGLQEIIDQMKADYINIIRARKHDMRPYVRELGSIERMMRQYIRNITTSDISSKMDSLLDHHKIALDKLKDLIDIFSEEQQFGQSEQFNINKYFVDLEINHDETTGYRIEYSRDDSAIAEYGIPVPCVAPYDDNLDPIDPDSDSYKELIEEMNKFPLIVDINHLDFERLVRNIIENAVTHGFTDSDCKDYGIGIDLTIDKEKGMFQIDFSNNGTPLPTGMDKQRYGILGEKAGTTGRTGRGGYIVKSIVEHYHGDYDVFTDGQNTVIRILLPIANYDYEYE